MESYYCRFCAELKGVERLLNLDFDDKKCYEITLKLAFLNAFYVNISHRDNIPNAICLSCYESLHNAYEFLLKVRGAQDILASIFSVKNTPKKEVGTFDYDQPFPEDDDFSALDFVKVSIKNETANVQVKIEPLNEYQTENIFHDFPNTEKVIEPIKQNLPIPESIDKPKKEKPSITEPEKTAKTSTVEPKDTIKSWKDYPWICYYCNDDFPSVDVLRSHSKAVHKRCIAFSCVDCTEYKKMSGKNVKRFVRHVKKHRPSLGNLCYYCDEDFTKTKKRLGEHLKKHFPEPSSVCQICGEIFQNKELCIQHTEEFLKRKPKIEIKDLICDICNKEYKTRDSFREHLKRHNNEISKHACDRCGKVFNTKGNLIGHIEIIHEKIHPHVCKLCNKAFRYPNMLQRHITLHTGEKPFSCEVCGKKFRSQKLVARHIIVHTDAMPYECEYCPKKFRFSKLLKQHLLQHTGVRPYSCDICLKGFSNWGNHNKHMKRSHNIETSKKYVQGEFSLNPESVDVLKTEELQEWIREVSLPRKRVEKHKQPVKCEFNSLGETSVQSSVSSQSSVICSESTGPI